MWCIPLCRFLSLWWILSSLLIWFPGYFVLLWSLQAFSFFWSGATQKMAKAMLTSGVEVVGKLFFGSMPPSPRWVGESQDFSIFDRQLFAHFLCCRCSRARLVIPSSWLEVGLVFLLEWNTIFPASSPWCAGLCTKVFLLGVVISLLLHLAGRSGSAVALLPSTSKPWLQPLPPPRLCISIPILVAGCVLLSRLTVSCCPFISLWLNWSCPSIDLVWELALTLSVVATMWIKSLASASLDVAQVSFSLVCSRFGWPFLLQIWKSWGSEAFSGHRGEGWALLLHQAVLGWPIASFVSHGTSVPGLFTSHVPSLMEVPGQHWSLLPIMGTGVSPRGMCFSIVLYIFSEEVRHAYLWVGKAMSLFNLMCCRFTKIVVLMEGSFLPSASMMGCLHLSFNIIPTPGLLSNLARSFIEGGVMMWLPSFSGLFGWLHILLSSIGTTSVPQIENTNAIAAIFFKLQLQFKSCFSQYNACPNCNCNVWCRHLFFQLNVNTWKMLPLAILFNETKSRFAQCPAKTFKFLRFSICKLLMLSTLLQILKIEILRHNWKSWSMVKMLESSSYGTTSGLHFLFRQCVLENANVNLQLQIVKCLLLQIVHLSLMCNSNSSVHHLVWLLIVDPAISSTHCNLTIAHSRCVAFLTAICGVIWSWYFGF